jgi:hypothetical protein
MYHNVTVITATMLIMYSKTIFDLQEYMIDFVFSKMRLQSATKTDLGLVAVVGGPDHFLVLLKRVHSLRHTIRLQALLIHELVPLIHNHLPGRSACDALMPGLNVWEAVKLLLRSTQDQSINPVIPQGERKISECGFVPNKPLLAFKCTVKYTQDPLQLIVVTLHSRRQLLWMKHIEPAGLTEVGTLATHLECQPLVTEVLFFQRQVAEPMLSIVLLNYVLDDSPTFPESVSSVGIVDS